MRRGNPHDVLPHLRRAQALIDGKVGDAGVPGDVLEKARQALSNGPLADANESARQAWERKAADRLQRQSEEDLATAAVRRARAHADEVTRTVQARAKVSPWPEVKPLVEEAERLQAQKAAVDEKVEGLSKSSTKLLTQINGLTFLSGWAGTSLLKALIVGEKPSGLVSAVAGWTGVDTIVKSAVQAYFDLEKLNVESFNIQNQLEQSQKSIEEAVRAHPETTQARAEVSAASLAEVKARMLREEAQEQERAAYRHLSQTMKAQWKTPEFIELATAASRLPTPVVKELDQRMRQHYSSAASSPSSSDPTFALTQGVIWWSLLSSTTSAQASPVLQDTAFLNNVVAKMVFTDVVSPGYTTNSAFSTGGGLESPGYSPSPFYDPSPSPSYDPSPSPSYDSSPSPSYDSGSSSSSFSSGGDF